MLFFCMLILLVLVVYLILEQSYQGKGLGALVGKTNAIYNTLYGVEGIEKIRAANKRLQEFQVELGKLEQMRDEAQKIVQHPGGKP